MFHQGRRAKVGWAKPDNYFVGPPHDLLGLIGLSIVALSRFNEH